MVASFKFVRYILIIFKNIVTFFSFEFFIGQGGGGVDGGGGVENFRLHLQGVTMNQFQFLETILSSEYWTHFIF